MSPRERDPKLPAIPEDKQAKLRSSSDWNDEDAEDREEQGLFEQDNALANQSEDGDGGNGATYPLANDGDDGMTNGEQEGSFYVQSSSGDAWELTWPIWHLLPRNERHAIAAQHGYKTIGDFEEYMSLTRAVDESGGGVMVVATNSGNSGDGSGGAEGINGEVSSDAAGTLETPDGDWHPPFIGKVGEGDDDSSVSSEEDNVAATDAGGTNESDANEADDDIDVEELIQLGGLPCIIPDEILHKAFSYLPVDDFASIALVSPHWSRFTRCESLYKSLCKRVYLIQSKRKTLQVSRFGSYRRMLEMRPRVRTGGGLYVLKYQEVRKIERDMWTEIPVGAILESVYYRYLYFFEDGRVMYALTHATPLEMIPRFSQMLIQGYGSKDKWGVWGRYQIKKDEVRVWASQAWHDVCFQLRIVPSNKVFHYDTGDRGMYTTMVLEQHLSSASGNFEDDSYDLVRYEIPDNCNFRFLRDRRL